MNTFHLGVMECDGIGHEVVPAAVKVLRAALTTAPDVRIEFQELPAGLAAIRSHGTALPDETLEKLTKSDGWILGPHDSQSYPVAHREKLNPSGVFRKQFQLFANVRPARAYDGLKALSPKMDLVIVRENTEGFYADRNMAVGIGEFMPTPDMAMMVGVFTREAAARVARIAFEIARDRRKHLTIVHKANVLRLTTGLYRDACREVAREYPDVTCDDFHVDAMTAHLVRRGTDFDVLVTENMFGDILSDLTGELAGSLGMAGSVNAGAHVAMAQAAHGAAPDIAGQGIANPVGMIVSVALLVRWLGNRHQNQSLLRVAASMEGALATTLANPVARTPDLGGTATTNGMTDRIIDNLASA